MNKTLLIISILLLSGCSQRIIDFTAISSKNIDLSRGADFKRAPARVKGEDRKQVFIIFPTGFPSAKEAMDKAIESVPGAVALLDGVVTTHSWYFPGIYGQNWIEVEGTPLIDPLLLKGH
ncbi:MAG: hypothetical protein M0Q44_18985 [Methylobacter sp.]|jgi:hypothetical protein|nr:hypothetical protein [Methylobacter sp.]